MQYIVVTAKHHEGFALFDTNYDRYNCVTGAPFGRDLIAELAEACAKHHMKLGALLFAGTGLARAGRRRLRREGTELRLHELDK